MGAAKEFLDRAADFAVFIIACAFVISGFAGVAKIHAALNNTLTDKGAFVVADAYPDVCYEGEEVIALLLLPDGIESIEIDGHVFSSRPEDGIAYINTEAKYFVTREFGTEGTRILIQTCTE